MSCTNTRTRWGVLQAAAVLGVMLLAAAPAVANPGAALSIAPNFPATTFPGDAFTAQLSIFNTSDADVPEIEIQHIHLNASCTDVNHPCLQPDGNVFDLGANGTGSLACAGVTFTIVQQGDDLYEFVPDATINLTRVGEGGQPCVIDFGVTTTGIPTLDSNPGTEGIQTRQVGHVTGEGLSTTSGVVEEASAIGTDTTTVQFNPEIDVTKDCDDVIGADGMITFSGTITNTGDVLLTNIELTDSHAGVIVLGDTDLAPGESVNYSGSYLPPDGEPIINTVTVVGYYDFGGSLETMVSDEASDECQQLIPSVALDKDCLPRVPGEEENAIDISVQNTGEVDLTGCVITDTLAGYESGPFDLAVGASADFDTAATGFGEDTLNTASVTCGVVGSDITVEASDEDLCEVPNCDVAVDKQVSCDGGATWVDLGYGDSVAEACIGWTDFDGGTASEVLVRYVANNTGDVDLTECTISESNSLLYGSVVGPFDLTVGGAEFEWQLDPAVACTDDLEAGEPDTAMISCACAGFGPEAPPVTDSDSADFECQTPALQVSKLCEPEMDDLNAVSITVTNVGEFDLADCEVVDTIYLDDPSCPADIGEGTLVESFELFNLAPGASMNLDTSYMDLMADACNTVMVSCDIVGAGGATISAQADDVCEAAAGCLTRTPGFWGTHPHIVEEFLPIDTCGLTINDAYTAIEDMCISGQDAKGAGTSMQHLQLIRQCTAAQLNIAASMELEGNCYADYPGLSTRFEECCSQICTGADCDDISTSGCIEFLDAFNNSEDTLDANGTVFQGPGPAQPGMCQDARGDGIVNDRNLCEDGGNGGGNGPRGGARFERGN